MKKTNNIQRDLFKSYNPPGDMKATTLCYKTKTFTVWPSENQCVIHSFGERTPRELRRG